MTSCQPRCTTDSRKDTGSSATPVRNRQLGSTLSHPVGLFLAGRSGVQETSVFSFQLLHDMHARLWTIVLFVVAHMLDSISRVREFTAMRKRYRSVPFIARSSLFPPQRMGLRCGSGKEARRRARKRAGLIRPPGLTGRCRAKATQSPLAKDKDVVLDVSPPALRSLTIDGKLSFCKQD